MAWHQVREETVLGETHYKAILQVARVRKKSFERGYRLAGAARWYEGDPPPEDASEGLAVRQAVCDHGAPCGCYAEGHAAGRAEARAQHQRDNEENIEALRRVMDSFNRAAK